MQLKVNYNDIDFIVDFDYQPAEETVMYYSDGTGYPGCSESIEHINSVNHKGTDFIPFFENANIEWYKDFEDLIWEELKNQSNDEN